MGHAGFIVSLSLGMFSLILVFHFLLGKMNKWSLVLMFTTITEAKHAQSPHLPYFEILCCSDSRIYVMATTVLPTAASGVQALGILTLKDFQQKDGIGPWMARVRIVRMWHEIDFMKTNDVTGLDLLLLDDTSDLLHAIVQKKFIWKFEPLVEEGMLLCLNNLTFAPGKKMFRPAQNDYRTYFNLNTDITPLEASSASISRHKFNFTELENLAAANTNTYLTDVAGVLTSHTNLQQFKAKFWQCKFHALRSHYGVIPLLSLPGTLKRMNLRLAGVYVKQYLGKASLSSTNATKIYFDLDIPEEPNMSDVLLDVQN
ncbi:hypothetical protein C5167_046350 [Papaver somniferum]|uniref:Replication protein A 70 kDa DNA-binding subunit B/D first OB fold domain-containing protein n=1 Tax=Papaver somniferum TaxID=3469 RepID=A0A4Y7LHD7_PAPSO|nr:hypothetical protein C5167_046350 [Papaver somniferum]